MFTCAPAMPSLLTFAPASSSKLMQLVWLPMAAYIYIGEVHRAVM